ncbi:MAG TPA: L-seryl-tRNA(Sec) selenium transferase [Gemmatimonadales bacterium]
MSDPRRLLPSVNELLEDPQVEALLAHAPRPAVVAAARGALASARRGRAGIPESWAAEIEDRLSAALVPSLRPVINATGVVLHTNLGRAPLADAAVRAIAEVAGSYSTLELDLHAGTRGERADHVRAGLAALAGADDALAVNNAAGGLVLAVNALAAGRSVAVSRGELIEIGGSFRIPEILERSGARLHEVGTTNRTHLRDYDEALSAGVAAILIVHRSNFSQRGFVSSPDPREVAALARERGIPVVYDVGGGLAVDLAAYGLTGEPTVQDAVASGAELVVFSGDKLFGGPQAGIVAGRAAMVDACRRNPLARALRPDRLTLAALSATAELYRSPETAIRDIPVLAMLSAAPASLRERAQALAALAPRELAPSVEASHSAVGGGAFPDAELPTTVVSLDPGPLGAAGLALRLRLGTPAVISRVESGRVMLDPRTILGPVEPVAEALRAALAD